jgi:hypothetical protein
LFRQPCGAGAAKERIEYIDALPARVAHNSGRQGIPASHACRRKENISEEVEIHAIIVG